MILGEAEGEDGAAAGSARAPGRTAVRDLGRVSLAHAPPMRLGPLMIEPALRRVAHDDGREEIVEPRVMQVMVALLRAEGAILSRDDLAACCWHGRIVGDDAINRVLSRLRRIADGIGTGIFRIETITKVGYRATVEASETAAANWPAVTPDARGSEPGQKPRRDAGRSWLTRAGWLLAAVFAAAAALLFLVRPTGEPESPSPLRLTQFVNLSPELPASLPASLREELLAAFGEDDAVPVVSSSAATAASGEAYALGGTLRRAGDRLRFTVRLTSETNGAMLWSDAIDGPAAEPAVALRSFATQVSGVVRCGLTGVAEHSKELPDRALSLYLEFCAEAGLDPGRALDAARRVTEAAPDFARGWSGLAHKVADTIEWGDPAYGASFRDEAAHAAERALRLDPNNCEALTAKAHLLPRLAWAEREAFHERSVRARRAGCGEAHLHHSFFLNRVGRNKEAVYWIKRARDLEPLRLQVNLNLAEALYVAGRPLEARLVMKNVERWWPETYRLAWMRVYSSLWTRRHDEALSGLTNENWDLTPVQRAALAATVRALASADAGVKAEAAAMLQGLPRRSGETDWMSAHDDYLVIAALGALGRDEAAIAAAERLIAQYGPWTNFVLFVPSMAGARHTPAFAALVGRLGLTRYWRETGRLPDFCKEAGAPSFCKTLS